MQTACKRFDTYAEEAKIADNDRGKELLSFLDDEPFRLVYQNGLVETKGFKVCRTVSNYDMVKVAWGWI